MSVIRIHLYGVTKVCLYVFSEDYNRTSQSLYPDLNPNIGHEF